MKSLILVSILSLTTLLPSFAQTADILYQKGKEHYERQEYREALYYFNKLIKTDSTKAEVFKWRGNCYFDLNKMDSAQFAYEKGLSLAPTMMELHYNLSSVYLQKKQIPEAEKSLRKYLNSRPDDISGLVKMAYLKRYESPDSALLYFEKAYALDSTNQDVIQPLASEYYYQGNFPKAIKFSTLAKNYNHHDKEATGLLAHSYFASGNYLLSRQWADSLIQEDPKSLGNYVLKVKSEILNNTDKNVMYGESYQQTFMEINSKNIKELDLAINDASGKYYYKTLSEKFKSGGKLGLDEYFMLYFGFTTDSNYSPYGLRADDLRKYQKEENYEAIIKECQEVLAKNETDPETLEAMALAQFRLGHIDEFIITLRNYIGVMEGILATGNGESFDKAFIVNSPSHEYTVLDYLGMNSMQQSLARHEGHDFDILKIKQEDDTEKDIYFNIDKPFGSLSQMFNKSSSKEGKEGKKKKNKKD